MGKKVLIIGAGPAGLMTAGYLLKAGIEVEIVEKAIFPRLVVGESLLPVSMEHFDDLELFEPLAAANFEKKPGVRFIRKGKQFDFYFSNQFTKNAKEWTWQVPRADFDHIIAQEIEKRGAKINFGVNVTGVEFKEKVELTFEKEGNFTTINGDFIVDSSGFGCVLPRLLGQEIKKNIYPNWAFFTHVEDVNAHLYKEAKRISFDILDVDLWFWVIPFSNGTTSLGFAGNKKHFNDEVNATEWFREMMKKSDRFNDRFKNVDFKFDPIWHKGYSQSATQLYGDRYVLVGNTLEFLDPVFSSGVALATASAKFASSKIIEHIEGKEANWEEYVEQIKQGINVFKTYVDSWYTGELQDIFFSNQFNEGFQQQICSVLAGYVWDQNNNFAKQHARAVRALSKVVEIGKK